MAYGAVSPPDARVSPEAFSEDEFPVFCPACDYPLRGLAGERCPECGRGFERGRLLVEQYVIEQGKRYWKRTSRYAFWSCFIGCGLMVLLAVCGWVIQTFASTMFSAGGRGVANVFILMRAMLAIGIFALICFAVSCALYLRLALVGWPKGKRVFAAIDKTRPTYTKAQRQIPVLGMLWLLAMACFFIWDVRDSRSLDYWLERPVRALALFVSVPVVASVCWLAVRFWGRRRHDGRRTDSDNRTR